MLIWRKKKKLEKACHDLKPAGNRLFSKRKADEGQ
jgi:hypothetical protein